LEFAGKIVRIARSTKQTRSAFPQDEWQAADAARYYGASCRHSLYGRSTERFLSDGRDRHNVCVAYGACEIGLRLPTDVTDIGFLCASGTFASSEQDEVLPVKPQAAASFAKNRVSFDEFVCQARE
jgi:hypothetical protein